MAERNDDHRSLLGRASSIALGAAFAVGDAVEGGVSTATNVAKGALTVAEVGTRPIRTPLDAIGVTDLVKAPVDAVADRVESTVASLDEKGRTGLIEGTGFAVESIGGIVDAVLAYVGDNPQVDVLVQAQIDKVLPGLATHPAVEALVNLQVRRALIELMDSTEVQALIQAQAHDYIEYLRAHPDELNGLVQEAGDEYIDYLNQSPAAVQALVQGQSISMASDIRDEVRERTVTADNVVDMIVRNVLRLKPAEELPLPPSQVQRRAEYGRLPTDYISEQKNGNH